MFVAVSPAHNTREPLNYDVRDQCGSLWIVAPLTIRMKILRQSEPDEHHMTAAHTVSQLKASVLNDFHSNMVVRLFNLDLRWFKQSEVSDLVILHFLSTQHEI